MEALDLPQSKVSSHMFFLKNTGFFFSKRSGKWVYYCLVEPDDFIQAGVLIVLCQGLPTVP